MGSEHEPRVAGGGPGSTGAAAADEAATRVASSAAATPEAPDVDNQQAGAAPQDGDEPGERELQDQPVEPSVPAGEPEAPVGPGSTPPHGNPLDEPASVEAPASPEDQLSAKAAKADEYLELAKRTKADFENYRKRAAREIAAAQERGIAKLARELLPGVDDLDRALEAAEQSAAASASNGAGEAESQLVSGIKLVHADVIAGLARVGIERFSPHGERFDPQQHEAVAQQPVEGAESGTIVEVYQRGYRLGETVLRPARVVVAQ
jgi:molecular chaperone GrpE